MATLTFVSRIIPTDAGPEVGGDELYLGVSAADPGPFLSQDGFVPTATAGATMPSEPEIVRKGVRYGFVLWNVAATSGAPYDGFKVALVDDKDTVELTATPPTDLVATAWYLPLGGIDGGPGGRPHVVTLGLDRTVNRFFRAPPIELVTPDGARTAGERVVYTDRSDVVIDATNRIDISTSGGLADITAVFEGWRLAGASAEDDLLTVGQGRTGLAIATYARRSHLHEQLTIPYWLWKALHGIVDAEVISHLRPGPIDGPDWNPARALARLRPVLDRLDPARRGVLLRNLDGMRVGADALHQQLER